MGLVREEAAVAQNDLKEHTSWFKFWTYLLQCKV